MKTNEVDSRQKPDKSRTKTSQTEQEIGENGKYNKTELISKNNVGKTKRILKKKGKKKEKKKETCEIMRNPKSWIGNKQV